MLRLAATSAMAVAFMAQAALAQGSNSGSGSGDKFSQCLCYNQNSKSFCHGNDWYNSQACQDWFFANYNWVFIVLILVFVMLAFPFIFCCSRFCCQCCGGRHATRGCCCSDTSTQAIFPGYTNRSIACTRIAFITSCALAATLTIVTFAHNTKFHNAANESISVFQQGAQQLAQYGNAVNQMAIYAQTPVNYFTAVNLAISPVNLDAVQTVSSTLQTVHDAENNNGYGRSHLTQMISCWALIVPVLAFIPMACSWKSSMNVFLIVQCFIATVLLIAIAPTAVFSEALTEACNHWDSTTAPFIQGALASAGVPSTMQQADSINMAINNILGGSGATSGSSGSAATGSGSNMGGTNFCADVQSVCAAIGGCMATPCANSVTMGCNGAQAPNFATFYNSFTSFNQQMTQFLNSACQGGNSINMAAANNQQAQSIVSFANAISGFQHVTQGQYVYQGWVSTMLTSAEMPLCVSLRVHAKNVAVSIGVQYLVALLIMISVFLGIKRFAKWNSYNPYAEYMGLTTEAPVITAIVVEINSDAPWSPSPAAGYGMVSPVAGTYVEAC